MFKLLKTVLKTGEATTKYPFAPLEVSQDFRGKPELNADQCLSCGACTRACPANALIMETDEQAGTRRWELSMARCIYCGRCEEVCPTKAIKLSQNFELAVTNKADLYESATFALADCSQCGRPFVARKLLEYVLDTLELSGVPTDQLAQRREQLETCPECRRRNNMLDSENISHLRFIEEDV
ncbi:TPA: formate hydrogenlyase complex iron-sulfur subunit [Photobacterium damselae]|uniref:4Fe-4S dicluster domain-containing protein n=2 Tax=Photobacterium damselae TaxID=38293 RepID=A0ACD3T066_PHODM|nr:formate hydrogenlyase complex iron-sulfur subunit [Photobacterium damselae]EHA1079911.1 4Fe-4S dicluster domain-containing protein [Photobacterium damselae]MCG3814017.1 4Fe-4S dicluster domain-containing protein [Photobacterium damselae]MCG9704901.1 4Fe-4S dicluster domain-containing protein [Photobacterium damselae]MDC4169764.1 4Fe-4S dicluster domain-containing protein [Photobacterium damselae]NVO75383.1 4Fe-4S dicluster domain-containing protein [Photobacterium damselae subsp. damselae]